MTVTQNRRGGRRRWLRIASGGIALLALFAVAGLGALIEIVRDVERRLPAPPGPQSIVTSPAILDRSGNLLRAFVVADGRWRLPVEHTDVDPRLLEMLIAYEDRRFRDHDGVDRRALVRAAGQFLAAGRIVSGASTLTMQVARLLDGTSTRNAAGKIRQIAMARALERQLNKDEILNLYLLLAPYGGNLEGIRAASLAYLGKEPARLTTAEAALLVALPQAPEYRRPDRHPIAARMARDRVLDRLVTSRTIDRETAEAAKQERVPERRRSFPIYAAHLAQSAVTAHADRPEVSLTIDRELQASLETLARDRITGLGPKVSGAVLVADHNTGEILASVGSVDLLHDARDGHVDMTQAQRSPGSTLKPLIYGLAFEQGLAHPESLIEDRPTGFKGYVPANFDGYHRGTVTIREALTQSLNVPAVVVLDAVGPARLMARLRRATANPTLPDLTAPGLAVGLGGIGISLRDLVSLYGAIARGGAPLTLNDGIEARTSQSPRSSSLPVLDGSAAWYVADILFDVPPPRNGSPGRLAYKTGTSYGYRDAWAIGFDGRHVVGVWIGRPDGAPVSGISGATVAAPLLFEAFDRIGPRRTPLDGPPHGIVTATTARLPAPLRRFRHPDEQRVEQDGGPEIAYPLNGVAVDLGMANNMPEPLIIKVRNGAPPFTFFANDIPVAQRPFARSEAWHPDGPGFVTLSVVDATGRSDRVTVYVE